MGLSVCPAAIVAAPVGVVWANLVQWERYFEWADVQVERREPEGPATVGAKDTSSTCMLFSHLDCKRRHTSPARPSTRPPVASNMAETSSSPQAGGVGSSKHLARKQSLQASIIPCSASSVPLKDSISKHRRQERRSGRTEHY
jgi:hypothetical protein